MPLTDQQMANIVFNETRSLSGAQILMARVNIVHVIMNADASPAGLPEMASSHAVVPKAEVQVYSDCMLAVIKAKAEAKAKVDPTSGATHFNFRKNAWQGKFYGNMLKTSVGPLNNSYPTDALPATGTYANTYE